jgi:hypothetical protein
MSADPLAEALRRWGAARRRRGGVARDAQTLAERLDERGCAYGRVVGARLDDLAHAHDRLESKLNAILLAVAATFISTLVGMLVQALRGGG